MQVEYELIRHGLRLRDLPSERLSWRDLSVILQCAPPESPLARALSECGHTAADHLYITHLYVAQVANWQRGGGKKSTQPKLPDCLAPEGEKEITRYGTRAMDIDDMAEWLGWAHTN